MPHTDAQPVEISLVSECADDVADAIVTAVTTAMFETCDAHLEIDLVVGYQHILRLDLIEIAHGSYRLAAVVHERSRE